MLFLTRPLGTSLEEPVSSKHVLCVYSCCCTNFLRSGAVLEAGGSSLAKAVKVNVFLANMDDFAAVNEVYGKFFPDPKPVSIL